MVRVEDVIAMSSSSSGIVAREFCIVVRESVAEIEVMAERIKEWEETVTRSMAIT
jgi:hypothetical protein